MNSSPAAKLNSKKHSMNTAQTEPALKGSWRNFSPKLDSETATLFNEINEATLRSLDNASRQSSILREEPAPYQAEAKKA
jgi:hypothetical protein